MARVEGWFDEFVVRLTSRIQRLDWPPAGDEFWLSLRSRFVHHGVSEAAADEGSLALMDCPPKFLDALWPDLLRQIRAYWEHGEASKEALASRETAQQAAAGCVKCGGREGLATLYRQRSAGGVDAKERPLSAAVLFYCSCAMGRWVKARHLETGERKALYYDLLDHPRLDAPRYRSPPDVEPEPDETVTTDPNDAPF